MAIYSVKYNPSLTYIPGATQVGNLAVAIGDVDYSTGGWIAGVPDDNGYVIYSDTTSLGLTGRTTASFSGVAQANMPTFYRSKFKTDGSLIQLINRIPGNTQTFNDINSAKAWLSSTGHTNILGGTYSGGGVGLGEWYFYSDEGPFNATPPIGNGNAIFTISGSPVVETYNPNGTSGTTYLAFSVNNFAGTSRLTQFTQLQTSGGTINVTQNGQTATFTSNVGGIFHIETQGGGQFLLIPTANGGTWVQTATTASPFVFGDPITITIS